MGRPPTISREQILQSARSAFTRKGFASATLADIAAELNVTPAAILRHFESKNSLFSAAMHTSIQLPACITDLQHVPGDADPRTVLRRVALEWIPFARTTLTQHLVLTMHEESNPTLVVPFDPRGGDSPPKRGLKIVAGYFARAQAAGRIRIEDPRAAALLFMGSLLSYVFIHHILKFFEPPYPLDAYVDALLDVWSDGAIAPKKVGGTRGRSNKQTSQANRPTRDHRDRGDRASRVLATDAKAEAGRSVGNAGGANGQRGVARRRTRHARVRR